MIGAGAAGITGGLGLLSSVTGNVTNAMAQQKANETNLQIARENNEFNERMMEKQMEYNTQMYEKSLSDSRETWQQQFDATNAYNTPAAQRQRLQEAGYNPLLMTQNVGTVSGSSATSTSGSVQGVSPAQAQPVQVQPARYDFSSVAGSLAAGMEMYMNYQKNQAEVTQLNIENKYKAQQIMRDLAESYSRQQNNEAKIKTLDALRDLESQQVQASITRTMQETQNMQATYKGLVIQNAMDSLRLKNLPQQLSAEISQIYGSIALMKAQGTLSEAQAKREAAQALLVAAQKDKTVLESNGIRISQKWAEQTADELYYQSIVTSQQMLNNIGPEGIAFGLGKVYGFFDYDTKKDFDAWRARIGKRAYDPKTGQWYDTWTRE